MTTHTILRASGLLRPRVAATAAGLFLAAAAAGAQTNFGAVNVGASATATVTLTLPAAATVANIAVVTQGVTGLDFTNAGGGSCATGINYTAGQACTIEVAFKPLYSGARYGAAELLDASGNVIASALLEGNGVGPQVAFDGGAAVAFAPMANGIAVRNPFDPVVDARGNLYFTDQNNARVVEIPAGGGAPIVIDPIVGGAGLSEPGGVAVDAAGNLYISDLDRNVVMLVPPNGGPATAIDPIVNGIGLHYPCGMAIDGAGNLYIADVDNARVVEVPAAGGAAVAIDPLVGGEKLSYPVTVALDSAGDLFVADLFANRIVEIPANGAATAIDPSVNGQSLKFPYGVAVDAAGDLFIADANNRVVEVPASGGSATAITPTVNGQGLNDPIGIALDAAGNLFIADSQNNRVLEIARGQAPTIDFAATPAGTASSDSPKTVIVENVGNAALTFPVPASGANPAISTNFTLNSGVASACPVVTAGATQAGTLVAGAWCALAISFQPAVAGAVYGSLVLSDNNLNAPGMGSATQTIALSGAAPVAAVSATMLAFGPQQVGTSSAMQQVTLTNAGSAPLAITNIAVSGANASAFVFPNPCGTSLAAGANCVIEGHFAPAGAGPMTATLAIAVNASSSPQSVALSGVGVYPVTVTVTPAVNAVTTAQALSVNVAVSGASGEPTPTGTVTLTATGASYTLGNATLANGSATIDVAPGALPVGSDNIVATFAVDITSALLYAGGTGSSPVTVTASSTATAPAAATGAATVNINTATLAGTVNPNGADTHTWFLWGTSSTLSGASQTPSEDLGSTAGSVQVSANITNLGASTTYYYQLVAQNSLGTTNGAIYSFTTDPAPYFQVVTGAPMSVVPGATGGNSTTVSVTPWYGFTGTVMLSCSIAPVAASDPATCSLPASVTVTDENAQAATISVTTTAASATNRPQRLWPGAGGAVLACVVLLFVPARRRGWPALMVWVVLFVALAGIGCSGNSGGGGGGGGGQKNPGTTPGTYTVTITGVSGGMTETGTVALTVQ
jgi:sugar lactone lactonase YvrE